MKNPTLHTLSNKHINTLNMLFKNKRNVFMRVHDVIMISIRQYLYYVVLSSSNKNIIRSHSKAGGVEQTKFYILLALKHYKEHIIQLNLKSFKINFNNKKRLCKMAVNSRSSVKIPSGGLLSVFFTWLCLYALLLPSVFSMNLCR